MGLIGITSARRSLSRNTQHHDPTLRRFRNDPEAMLRYCEDLAKGMGYRVTKKSSLGTQLSKMTTTYFQEIRLGQNWDSFSPQKKACLFAHELVHARQWRHYGPVTFGTSYIMDPSFRWAMEVQAYCESVKTYKILGARSEWLEDYARNQVQRVLWNNYKLGVLRRDHVRNFTRTATLAALKS